MKITELKKHIENLPNDLKMPILALIEFKTESDMEKALDRMTGIEDRLEAKMTGIKQELETRMTGIESKISTVLWTVGVGFSLMLIVLSIFQFLK